MWLRQGRPYVGAPAYRTGDLIGAPVRVANVIIEMQFERCAPLAHTARFVLG